MSELSSLSRDQIEILIRDSNDSEISKRFKVSRQAVYNIRKKFSINPHKNNFKDMVIELRKKGFRVTQIVQSTGKSQSYIYKILHG